MSQYVVKWLCPHGHTGTEFFESEVLADVRAAYIRMGVCNVCGAGQLGTSFAPQEAPAVVPEAPATEPEVKASKSKK
jgi:hypothetical protein